MSEVFWFNKLSIEIKNTENNLICVSKMNKDLRAWDDMRVNKWRQNFHFLNIPLSMSNGKTGVFAKSPKYTSDLSIFSYYVIFDIKTASSTYAE